MTTTIISSSSCGRRNRKMSSVTWPTSRSMRSSASTRRLSTTAMPMSDANEINDTTRFISLHGPHTRMSTVAMSHRAGDIPSVSDELLSMHCMTYELKSNLYEWMLCVRRKSSSKHRREEFGTSHAIACLNLFHGFR